MLILWSIMNIGTKEPNAGSMKSKDSHLALEHAFFMLKTKKRSTLASIKTKDIAFTANIPLQIMLPMRKGWKN